MTERTVGRWALPEADTYFAPPLTDRGFEIEKLDAAMSHVKQWRTAVDGGAHIGTWSVSMAARFASVLAFEPAPDTFDCLVSNLAGIANVVPMRAALGAVAGRAGIGDDTARPGNTGARHLGAGRLVEVDRLDDFGIDDLDFLKLDLEGYELFALTGAKTTILQCRPAIIIEDKDFGRRFGCKPGAALRLLESWGAREVERIRNDHIFVFDT